MSDICAIQSVLSCRVASFCSLNGRTGAAPAQRCWTEHHFIRTSWNLFPPELQQFLFEAARAVGIYSSAPQKLPSGPWKLWGAEVQGSLERTHGRRRSAAFAGVLCPTFPFQAHESSVQTQEAPSHFPYFCSAVKSAISFFPLLVKAD